MPDYGPKLSTDLQVSNRAPFDMVQTGSNEEPMPEWHVGGFALVQPDTEVLCVEKTRVSFEVKDMR